MPGTPAHPSSEPTLTSASVGEDLFSPGLLLELGFSFVVGLAIGYALKIAIKIALIVAGVVLLSIFALQYAGIADVNWSGVELKYAGLTDWLGAFGGPFKDFISRNLPNAASFSAGLLVGLKL